MSITDKSKKVSRADFLKASVLGAIGVGLLAKSNVLHPEAAVTDNLNGSGGGVSIGTTAPANKKLLWIDTATGKGIAKYWNGSAWTATTAVWS